jgi:hypothetical protein
MWSFAGRGWKRLLVSKIKLTRDSTSTLSATPSALLSRLQRLDLAFERGKPLLDLLGGVAAENAFSLERLALRLDEPLHGAPPGVHPSKREPILERRSAKPCRVSSRISRSIGMIMSVGSGMSLSRRSLQPEDKNSDAPI